MWKKAYGHTGKDISVVGCGGMRFAHPSDLEANGRIVRHAHSRGINYFDTAPGYGESEEIFGAAFKHMKRDEFYVSTKSSKSDGDALRADLETSLKRMGIDHIDFFHIWCVMSLEAWKARQDGGAVEAALRAKEEGLVGHVVVSSHMIGEEVEQMLREGPFEGVTLGYCAINFPYRDRAVAAAGEMGIGVVTMNPLGGGIIPRNPEYFDFLRGPDDPSVVAAAIRFNISNPSITSALVGFTTEQHVDEAVEAVEGFKPYDASHIRTLRERALEGMNELCTGCGYCLPCPEGIAVPKMMETYNTRILGGSDKDMLGRMKWHWGITPQEAATCTRCGLCEERCTQYLPIRDRLAELAKLE